MEEKIWKNIKCKKCETQEKRLFMMRPSVDANDCFCEECLEVIRKERAFSP